MKTIKVSSIQKYNDSTDSDNILVVSNEGLKMIPKSVIVENKKSLNIAAGTVFDTGSNYNGIIHINDGSSGASVFLFVHHSGVSIIAQSEINIYSTNAMEAGKICIYKERSGTNMLIKNNLSRVAWGKLRLY